MKHKERPVPDERVQKAWTALSARFYFVLLAALVMVGAVVWTQTGRWLSALPEMLGLAVGVIAALFFLTSGKAWRGKDEAVSERRNISLHAAFFLMNWVTYIAVFAMYFIDRDNGGWHLFALFMVAVVYFARRILAARCGLILYKTEQARRRGDRYYLWGSVILGALTAGMSMICLVLLGIFGWVTAVIAVAGGGLTGWLFWRYYRWLIAMSEKAADAEVAGAEKELETNGKTEN